MAEDNRNMVIDERQGLTGPEQHQAACPGQHQPNEAVKEALTDVDAVPTNAAPADTNAVPANAAPADAKAALTNAAPAYIDASLTDIPADIPTAPVYLKEDKLFLAGALLLGILFTLLFYGKHLGISVPLFIIAFYVLLFVYARPVPGKKDLFAWLLCVPVMLISLTFFIFRNVTLMVLNALALPWLIILQTVLVTGANSYRWYSPGIIADLFFGIFARSLIHIAKPFRIFASILRSRTGGEKKSTGIRIAAGIVIALPLLLILVLLLSSADMVFGRIMENVPEYLEAINFGEFLGKALVTLLIFLTSFSYIWSLKRKEKFISSADGLISVKTADEKRKWDPVVLITVTASIDLLYIFFVIIQFTYLFGRSGLPEGFTYSEYARSGFSELIMVSLLNMGLLALTLTYTKKGTRGLDITFRLLNTITICCTFVMLASAYYRMLLYEEAYGFTFLRIMTRAFMIFLFVLFAVTMARVWNDRLPLLKPYIAAALVAFTVVNYINVDAMIAGKNIERYYRTGIIDIYYLSTLSNDAVGELIKLADSDDPEVAEEVRGILEERKESLYADSDWQSFNLADYRAKLALDGR